MYQEHGAIRLTKVRVRDDNLREPTTLRASPGSASPPWPNGLDGTIFYAGLSPNSLDAPVRS